MIGAALAVVVTVLVVAEVRHRRRGRATRAAGLPKGADAALWSIVEAVPDPRNHLALTRDLSGEVRLTELDRQTAAAAYAAAGTARTTRLRARREPAPAPAPAVTSVPNAVAVAERPATVGHADAEPITPRSTRARRARLEAGDEDHTLSSQLFFAGEPELKPF